MEKRCSGCNDFHIALFGSRCKLKTYKLCSRCGSPHRPPFGSFCKGVSDTTLELNMARSAPIVDTFKDRSDPDYLKFLEDSFLETADKGDSEMTLIRRRLEALESRSVRSPAVVQPA